MMEIGHSWREVHAQVDKVGRNDPCPCGSGLKYKKCCLGKNQAAPSRSEDEHTAVGTAVAWLKTCYPEEVEETILLDYFGDPDEEEFDSLHDLSDGLKGMLEINVGEWLLTDAFLEIEGKRVRAIDLVLGMGGPLLPARGKEWLHALGENPLSLYEVRQATPGEGLELKDLLRREAPVVKVLERTASRSLVRWDTFGARLAREDDRWVLTGALYPMDRERALECCEEILREMGGEEDWGEEISRDLVGCIISEYWLEQLTEKRPLPKVVDASTGEPIALTTDRYRVSDWDALIGILSAQPDVEGDLLEGWVRFEPLENEARRSRAALTKKSADALEVFCRTLKLADEARRWLEEIAGTVVRFKGREIVDPMSPKAREATRKSPQPKIPPELKVQVEREFLRRHYERWPDEPLPALGGKTPKAAVRTKKGRQAVIELLKEFELHEARKALGGGGEPFDFGFLWKRLGLENER
ncbi:MAG: SEC-C metal-binding domain-containing protein [Candidatus Deferrimicrobiota bacterium]